MWALATPAGSIQTTEAYRLAEYLRTFLAVEIDEAVRQRAAELIQRLRSAVDGVTWVAPQNLHITLKFLGDVASSRIAELSAAVRQAVAAAAPFEFEIRGLGAFPRIERPNNLWIGCGDGAQSLIALAERLDHALSKLGFARESRPLVPHLTLGRLRRAGKPPANLVRMFQEHAEFVAGRTWVRHVVLFSSQLTPRGSIYTPLDQAPLAGA